MKEIKFQDEFIELIKSGKKTATTRDKIFANGIYEVVNKNCVSSGIFIEIGYRDKIRYNDAWNLKDSDVFKLVLKEGFSDVDVFFNAIEKIYGTKKSLYYYEFKVVKQA